MRACLRLRLRRKRTRSQGDSGRRRRVVEPCRTAKSDPSDPGNKRQPMEDDGSAPTFDYCRMLIEEWNDSAAFQGHNRSQLLPAGMLNEVDEDDLTSTKKILAFYLTGPVLSGLIAAGMLSNLLCMLVLSRPRRLPRINVYLMTLACWDLLLVISSLFLFNLPMLSNGVLLNYKWYVQFTTYAYGVMVLAHTGSVWSLMLMSGERYFALCHPLRHRMHNCSLARVMILLGCIALLSLLYSIPRLFEVVLVECLDEKSGVFIPQVTGSTLRDEAVYWVSYRIVGGIIFYSVGPFLTLSALSARVAAAVHRGASIRRRMAALGQRTNGCKQQRRPVTEDTPHSANVMLVVVVIKFLFCYSLPAVLDLCESTMGSSFHHSLLIDVLIDVSHLLVVGNSACNVVVYFMCSRRFREDLKHRFAWLRHLRFRIFIHHDREYGVIVVRRECSWRKSKQSGWSSTNADSVSRSEQ